MRWLTVAGVLLYLTRCNDAGALKCYPGKQDPLCALEKKEISPVQNLIEREPETSSDESQCLPGSEWESNCHQCRCSGAGFAECNELDSCVAAELGQPVPCKPNTTFSRNGTTCICLENGLGLCTLRFRTVERRIQHKREIPEVNATSRNVRALPESAPKACQPGQEFRMDCNKCLCDNEGQDFSCTRIDCAALNNNNNGGGDTRRKRDTTAQMAVECVPGSVFDRDCNVCRCTEDGKHAACTLKRCQQDSDVTTEPGPSFRCTPGDQFRRDCNDCTCSADGKNVFCTLRLCDEVLGDI